MASTAELYWANSRQCMRWAENAESDDDREAFLEMANVWTQLAMEEGLSAIAAPSGSKQNVK
jgi:hypothetical protein